MPPRRTPASRPRPRGRTGPGRAPGAGRAPSRPVEPATGATAMGPASRRPRVTGRMAVLVLVVAVLTLSAVSSMRTYLQQRSQIEQVKAENATREAHITSLVEQRERLKDPDYVAQLAREELGYVKPGETLYVVTDHGKPLDARSTLTDPRDIGTKKTPDAWWSRVWGSDESAGDPPKQQPLPVTTIHGSSTGR